MSNKLESIESQDISIGVDGVIELSDDLQSAIAGGFSPEEAEEECNTGCNNTVNHSCGSLKQLK